MGLFQKACETYDTHASLAGVAGVGKSPLLPICHILQKAQIQITVDLDGGFVLAEEVDKDDAKTIIPATEASASRTYGIAAHPLCDQVCYVSTANTEKHEDYIKELTGWVNSEYSHPKVEAVLKYVRKDTLFTDLERVGLIKKNDSGKIEKIAGTEYEKCMIRWKVLDSEPHDQSWMDTTLFESFQNYVMKRQNAADKEFCMIEGVIAANATSHPKGIVSAQYGAKLISFNDNNGFTYRGRFDEANQAATISYIASQKAHNALQWVVANQGVIVGKEKKRTFVCWNPQGGTVPQPLNLFLDETKPVVASTDYKKQLYQTITGFKNELPEDAGVVIASFDAATTGRLALTYYSELASSDFLDRIETWYNTCYWGSEKFGFKSPNIRNIAMCAFGTQHGQFLDLDDRVLREQVQRLLVCIIDGAPIPFDIVKALAQRASTPLAYDKGPRELILATACAVIRKHYNDKRQKEIWTVALDPQKKDVSYQYGRLLAVLEKVERDTYDKKESREPNAIRLQTVFTEQPAYAARILHERLNPYFEKLRPKDRAFYKKLIGEIMVSISELNGENMHRLKDTYLMGYYLQRAELYKTKLSEAEDKQT